MKKIIPLILLTAFVSGVLFLWTRTFSSKPSVKPLPTPPSTPEVINMSIVQFKNESYAYALIRVSNPDNVELLPNFDKKEDTATLMKSASCVAGINGGFYDTNSKPLGLFVADGKTLRAAQQNMLINGYVWIDNEGTSDIASSQPSDNVRFALQTGPLLLLEKNPLPLRIKNDEPARRMVVAKTIDNTLLFITVYTPAEVFQGPYLADLPLLLVEIAKKEHFSFASAVNLDGGSASSFVNGTVTLSEITPVGSLFCVK